MLALHRCYQLVPASVTVVSIALPQPLSLPLSQPLHGSRDRNSSSGGVSVMAGEAIRDEVNMLGGGGGGGGASSLAGMIAVLKAKLQEK